MGISQDPAQVYPPHAPEDVRVEDGLRCLYMAELHEPASGRKMDVWSSAPGLQLYTGNWLKKSDPVMAQAKAPYDQHGGVCLEPQLYPDSPHHPHFPVGWHLRPGETYRHLVIHRFT
jgi:aldose 1-epimerase